MTGAQFVTVTFLAMVTSTALASNDRQEIRLSVAGAESDTGQILVSLFDSAENFLATPILEMTVDVDGTGSATVSLGQHRKGKYALAIIYDKNGNGKLDTGVFRIPKEKTGFSNNASSRFGPAKWEEANFSLTDSDVVIEIQLR